MFEAAPVKVRVTVVPFIQTGPTTTVSPDSSTPFRFDVAPVPCASTFMSTADGSAGVGVAVGVLVGVEVGVAVAVDVGVRVLVGVGVRVLVGVGVNVGVVVGVCVGVGVGVGVGVVVGVGVGV